MAEHVLMVSRSILVNARLASQGPPVLRRSRVVPTIRAKTVQPAQTEQQVPTHVPARLATRAPTVKPTSPIARPTLAKTVPLASMVLPRTLAPASPAIQAPTAKPSLTTAVPIIPARTVAHAPTVSGPSLVPVQV